MRITFLAVFLLLNALCFAQFDIHLDLGNHHINESISGADPVILDILIADFAGAEQARRNQFNQQHRSELTRALKNGIISDTVFQRELELIKVEEVPVVAFDYLSRPWYEHLLWQIQIDTNWVDWKAPLFVLDQPISEEPLIMGGERNVMVSFGIDPGYFYQQDPITIKVGLAPPSEVQAENKIVWSPPFEIRASKTSGDVDEIGLARYWFRRGLVDRAFSICNELLVRDQQDVETYTLLGDIHVVKGEAVLAVQAYQDAIEAFKKEFPDSNEGPQGIRMKIATIYGEKD